jgi:hypothetical protein
MLNPWSAFTVGVGRVSQLRLVALPVRKSPTSAASARSVSMSHWACCTASPPSVFGCCLKDVEIERSEVSIVNQAANPHTSATVRSLEQRKGYVASRGTEFRASSVDLRAEKYTAAESEKMRQSQVYTPSFAPVSMLNEPKCLRCNDTRELTIACPNCSDDDAADGRSAQSPLWQVEPISLYREQLSDTLTAIKDKDSLRNE